MPEVEVAQIGHCARERVVGHEIRPFSANRNPGPRPQRRSYRRPMSNETALREAKRPRTILAGPYGHPFHALLVTIPIGAWVASFVFDIVSVAADDAESFGRGALWLIGIGLVGAVVAAAVGLMDLSGLTRGTRVRRSGSPTWPSTSRSSRCSS